MVAEAQQQRDSSGLHRFSVGGEVFLFEPETLAIRRELDVPPESSGRSSPPPSGFDTPRPLRSLSLAVSQACNMACSYCYASKGSFGGRAQLMDKVVALAAIQGLIESTPRGERINIAFMGGEPLLNRKLIHQATCYAVAKGKQHDVAVSFSLTSNGILIGPADIELFRRHRFSITISIDGTEEQQDRQRPLTNGSPSYLKVVDAIQPLLRHQAEMYVGARVTVRRDGIDLPAALANLREVGFRDIGFSPLLNAPSGEGELRGDDLVRYLNQMKECGDEALERLGRGECVDFSNLKTALREIHFGRPKSHPCGAGNGYAGVGADANLYRCHRYINDADGRIGTLLDGVDLQHQQRWIGEQHVDRQLGCAACWARNLCGGGCYHEVEQRGRPACEMIRGWMDYCLKAWLYVHMTSPGYLEAETSDFPPTV